MIEFLALAPGTRVVEIGAGAGALTGELLATGAQVLALELDPAWAFDLRRALGAASAGDRLSIAIVDALEVEFARVPRGTVVAGNLPYNVGTAIVERVLAAHPAVERAAFLLQREVVDRLAAAPGDPAYGALSVIVAARARARRIGRVAPGAFVPAPRVESAFVGLELHPPPLPLAEMLRFDRLVHLAFARRRKTLRNALAAEVGASRSEAWLEAAGIDATRRAEELSLAEFLRLDAAAAGAAGATISGAAPAPR